MEGLANKIFDSLVDMDFRDYAEHLEKDLKDLMNDLILLEKHGNGAFIECFTNDCGKYGRLKNRPL